MDDFASGKLIDICKNNGRDKEEYQAIIIIIGTLHITWFTFLLYLRVAHNVSDSAVCSLFLCFVNEQLQKIVHARVYSHEGLDLDGEIIFRFWIVKDCDTNKSKVFLRF